MFDILTKFKSEYENYQQSLIRERENNLMPDYSREAWEAISYPAKNKEEFDIRCSADIDFFERWIGAESHIKKIPATKDESFLQKKILLDLILYLVNHKDFWQLERNGQVYYLLNNALASWSGYNHIYFMSKRAEEIIKRNISNPYSPLSRNKIFNLRNSERKKLLTFEHVIPVSFQRTLLSELRQKNNFNEYALHDFLAKYGAVCVITQEENNKLREEKLNTSMGDEFQLEKSSLWNRYEQSQIEISNNYLSVFGKMYR